MSRGTKAVMLEEQAGSQSIKETLWSDPYLDLWSDKRLQRPQYVFCVYLMALSLSLGEMISELKAGLGPETSE